MKFSKFFVSTLIAAAAMTATAYAEGEIISLNFTNGNTGKITETATGEGGLVPVGAEGWVNISSAGDTTLTTGESVATTLVGTWESKTANPSTVDALLLKGYVDVLNRGGENHWKVEVSNISYLSYDIYAYFAGDSAEKNFASISLNGQSYIGDATNGSVAVSGPTGWGSLNNTATTLQLGVNALKVSDVVGSNVVLTSDWVADNVRATLAGIQIVNTYTGTATSVALDRTETSWTRNAIGSVAWTNSTAGARTYAAFKLTADTVVNVSEEGITTDAITASGRGTLTLSENEITLIGPGIVRTDSDTASIVVNNNLTFSDGGSISGNVTLNGVSTTFKGDGSIYGSVKISGSTIFKGENVVILSDSLFSIEENASLRIEKGVTLDLGIQDSGVSKNISGAGTVKLGSSSGGHSAGIKLSEDFAGVVEFSGKLNTYGMSLGENATLKLSKYASHSYSSLWGGGTLNCDVLFQTDYQIGDSQGVTTTFNGAVTGAEGATLTLGGTGAGNVIAFKGDASFDRVVVYSGTTTFSGATSVDSMVISAGTVKFDFGALNTSAFNENSKIAVDGGTLILGYEDGVGDTMSVDSFGENLSIDVASGATLKVGIAKNSIKAYAGNLTLKNGATYYKYDGGVELNGNVALGESDTDVVYLLGNWGKIGTKISGTLSGAGTAYFANYEASDTATEVLTISGNANTYSGELIVGKKNGDSSSAKNVELVLAAENALQYGKVNLAGSADNNYAQLTLGADKITIAGLSGTAYGKIALGTGIASSTLTVNGGGAFAGTISDNVNLTKTGAGTLTLSNANTYSGGTTIEAGTLVAAHQNALGGGNVTMSGGALKTEQATTLSGNIILGNGKAISLELDGALTVGWIGVNGNDKAASVNIDFGTDGKIVAGYNSIYGGGINFTDSDDVTFTIVSTTEADTYSSVAVSDLIGRVLLSATNGANVAGNGVNGIWNLAESSGTMNALKIVVENALGATLLDATATFVNNNDGTFTWFDSQSGLELLLSQSSLANGESTLTILSVPEPSAFGLLAGLGAVALCVLRRRRNRR